MKSVLFLSAMLISTMSFAKTNTLLDELAEKRNYQLAPSENHKKCRADLSFGSDEFAGENGVIDTHYSITELVLISKSEINKGKIVKNTPSDEENQAATHVRETKADKRIFSFSYKSDNTDGSYSTTLKIKIEKTTSGLKVTESFKTIPDDGLNFSSTCDYIKMKMPRY